MNTVWLRNPRTVGPCDCGRRDARLTPGGWTCGAGTEPSEPVRPAGHGAGLDGPTCPERGQPQFPDTKRTYRTRMCIRCGRITALLDADGVGWCGGELPAEYLPAQPVRHLAVVRR